MEEVEVRPLIVEAKRIGSLPNVPVSDIADLPCSPSPAKRCSCADVSYKDLPDYSIFDLTRISRDKASTLLRNDIIKIEDLEPGVVKLSKNQAIQAALTKKKVRQVDTENLKAKLEEITYPLYFLDYETYNFALPRLDGFKPYQHYVFQYSLHVQDSPNAELQHHEFLADTISIDSLTSLASSLRSAIHRDGGSVLVWHRQFEESRNGELGELLPEFRDFFLSLNHRIFDLEEVFKQQLIMDYHFKGRSSFKAIRRILCAQFSYTDLNVQNGAQAMYAWYEWVQGTLNTELLAYCKLDTLAMVEILCEIARS